MKFVLLISSLFLFHVASGVKISCTETKVGEWSYLGKEIKSCRVEKDATFSSSNLIAEIDSVDSSLVGVEFLYEAKAAYIPHGLTKIFPGMRGLYFHTQPLKTVSEEDMKQFGSQIEYFQVYKCQVTFLNKDVFKHNTNMQYINFQENPLQFIEHGFFETLAKIPTMKQVSFVDCDCIKLSIWETGKLLSEIPDIYEAEINKNQIKHTCNKGSQVQTVPTYSNVEILFYGNNFDSQCKFFVYGENSLVGDIVFGSTGAKDIKILTIKDSVTKYIPINFGAKFSKLVDLTFDSVGLVKVTKQSLTSEFKALQRLNFANNALVNIPNDAFEYLTSLETLDLSYNSIYSFNPVVVKNLSNLKNLYLSGNGIKSIVGNFFDVLPKSIKVVSLQNTGCINMIYPGFDKTEITKKITESCTWPAECLA